MSSNLMIQGRSSGPVDESKIVLPPPHKKSSSNLPHTGRVSELAVLNKKASEQLNSKLQSRGKMSSKQAVRENIEFINNPSKKQFNSVNRMIA